MKSIYIYSSIKSSLNPFPALLGLKYEQPPSAIWALCFRFLVVGCCDPVAEEERMWAVLLSGFRDGEFESLCDCWSCICSWFYYTFFSKLRCNHLGVLCVICGGFVQREVGLKTEERGRGISVRNFTFF